MKRLVDVITVLLLIAAFGMAYYTGFVGENAAGDKMLSKGLLAVISMAGSAILFAVGSFNTLLTRWKRDMLTVGSVIFGIIQFACVVGICVIMSMICFDMFKLDNGVLRALYLIFTAVVIIGYIDSLLFTDSLVRYDEAAAFAAVEDGVDVQAPQQTIAHSKKDAE